MLKYVESILTQTAVLRTWGKSVNTAEDVSVTGGGQVLVGSEKNSRGSRNTQMEGMEVGRQRGVEMIIVYLLSNHNDKQIYVIYMFLSFFLFLNLCHASLHSPSLLFFEIQKGGAIPITPPPDPPMEANFHN